MSLLITSLQNIRVKEAVKLRDRRGREKQGRIIVDGTRELGRAIDAGLEFIEIFVCEQYANDAASRDVLQIATDRNISLLYVTPDIFGKIAFGERAEGLIGIARTPQRILNNLKLPDNPLIAVLVGIEKPGNIGAVLRSADGAGVSAVIVADGGTDLYNPNTIRASLGTIFTLPVCCASSSEAIQWLRKNNVQVFAARVDGSVPYTTASYVQPTAFALGSESHGLDRSWTDAGITNVSLPMNGTADSLNVSTTAAILFYEALRQRS